MAGNNATPVQVPTEGISPEMRTHMAQKTGQQPPPQSRQSIDSLLAKVGLQEASEWVDPRQLLLFGPPKVGKTTLLSHFHQVFPDNKKMLILDLEEGGHAISGFVHHIKNLQEFKLFAKEIVNGEHDFTHVAIDVIDQLVMWLDSYAVWLHNKINETKFIYINDIPYGAGTAKSREELNRLLNFIKKRVNLIIVGHRKVAMEVGTTFDPTSLDMVGKTRNQVCGMSDAIGYVFRDDQNQLMISFQSTGTLDAGSRCPQLAGRIIPADWRYIYR